MSTEITIEKAGQHGAARRLVVRALMVIGVLVVLAFTMPSSMGFSRYVVTGVSMTGTYDRGSVLFERTVAVDELKVGDVITFPAPAESGLNSMVTHRIVELDGTMARTKGDHNQAIDPWQVNLGAGTAERVVAGVPAVGYAFMAMSDSSTRYAVAALPVLIVALMGFADFLAGKRRKDASTAPSSVTVAAAVTPSNSPDTVDVPGPRVPAGSLAMAGR